MKDICRDIWKKVKEVVDPIMEESNACGPEKECKKKKEYSDTPKYKCKSKQQKYTPYYYDDWGAWPDKFVPLGPNVHQPEDKATSQSFWYAYKLFDKEFVDKIRKIVDAIEIDDDGWVNVKLNLKVKKENDV